MWGAGLFGHAVPRVVVHCSSWMRLTVARWWCPKQYSSAAMRHTSLGLRSSNAATSCIAFFNSSETLMVTSHIFFTRTPQAKKARRWRLARPGCEDLRERRRRETTLEGSMSGGFRMILGLQSGAQVLAGGEADGERFHGSHSNQVEGNGSLAQRPGDTNLKLQIATF